MKTIKQKIIAVVVIVAILALVVIITNKKGGTESAVGNSSQSASSTLAITASADEMGKALLSKDYEKFIVFTHPSIIQLAGSKEKLIRIMKDDVMKDVNITKLTFGKVGEIIDTGTELQAVLPQTLELEVPEGTIITTGALIAISPDKGQKWYFMDTGGNSLERLRAQFPNLSPNLVIPPQPEPQFIKK